MVDIGDREVACWYSRVQV